MGLPIDGHPAVGGEIAEGKYGCAPPGKKRQVLGHESLGPVMDPGASSSLQKEDKT
jgi:hypothetical protein